MVGVVISDCRRLSYAAGDTEVQFSLGVNDSRTVGEMGNKKNKKEGDKEYNHWGGLRLN